MKANVVMAPVNWRLAGPEIAFIVEDYKAPVLFVGPEFIEQEDHVEGLDRMRSAGKPLPGVELAVLDADGNKLPPGEVGKIATRSGSQHKFLHATCAIAIGVP
jgi:acyl-CoA synthetase (AMP-forming)/AMP-acid ligase II